MTRGARGCWLGIQELVVKRHGRATARSWGWPVVSEWPATAPQLLGGGQERHDGAWGGCLAPGVAASCLPGVANFPTSSFQPSNGHPETSFRPILAREGAFEMGSGQSSCQHRPLRLRASRFGRSVNFPWTLGAKKNRRFETHTRDTKTASARKPIQGF